MESSLKQFSCQEHPNEYIVRTTFDPSSCSPKVLFCVECLLKTKPNSKPLSLIDYFNEFLELNKSLPNFIPVSVKGGLSDDISEFLNSEAESLLKLNTHIEDQKVTITKFYDTFKQETMKVIEDKKNEAIASLHNQSYLLQSNFIFLKNQSEAIFNGKFPVTFSSLDEAIVKANKFTSENELSIFIQSLNDQINQRKALSGEPTKIEHEIKKQREILLEKAREFRGIISGELPSFNLADKIDFVRGIPEMIVRRLDVVNELSRSLIPPQMSRFVANSKILLSTEEEDFLSEEEDFLSQEIHKNGRVRYELLYRGSRDGFEAVQYHKLCSKKSPLLVLIKTDKESRFGGYSEEELDSQKYFFTMNPCQSIQGKLTFLFNLDRKEI